jgi:hypothetical protein
MIERALLIKSPWIEKILAGEKTWEIRGNNIKIRGPVALIRSGSGLIVGVCKIVDVIPFASVSELERFEEKHCVPKSRMQEVDYKKPHAWVIEDAKPLARPILYQHPNGAIGWVNLSKLPNFKEMQGLLTE